MLRLVLTRISNLFHSSLSVSINKKKTENNKRLKDLPVKGLNCMGKPRLTYGQYRKESKQKSRLVICTIPPQINSTFILLQNYLKVSMYFIYKTNTNNKFLVAAFYLPLPCFYAL